MQKEENEIRVKAGNPATPYINRAATLLLRDQVKDSNEKALDSITFKASGKAIHTSLIASDVVRRKIGGLHQINRISSITVNDRRKGSTGSERDVERNLCVFEIVLTRNPSEAQKKEPGYIGVLKRDNDAKDSTLQEIVERRRRQVGNNYRRRQHNHDHDEVDNRPQRRYNSNNRRNDDNYNRRKRSNDNRSNKNYNNDKRNFSKRENQGNNRRRYDDRRGNNNNNQN